MLLGEVDVNPVFLLTKMSQVTNGLEAAYNFARGSPVIELTDARVGELADGMLTVRLT
jgi:hypothetical protein